MPLILKHASDRFKYAREQAGLSFGQASRMLVDAWSQRFPTDNKTHWFQGIGLCRCFSLERLEAPPESHGDNLYDLDIVSILADIYAVSPLWLLFGRSEKSEDEVLAMIPPHIDAEDADKLRILFESCSAKRA